MRDVGHGLWEREQDFKFFGANIGTKMNVAETISGLFIHSPVKLTDGIKRELSAIGKPGQIVAPNLFHHLFVEPYLHAYPEAKFYTIPELAARRPDLLNPIIIEDGQRYPWSSELDHFVFRGGRWFKEVIFCHRASKTLILTDFAFNLHDTGSYAANLLLKATKTWKRFGQTGLEKLLIRDRQSLRNAYDRIMAWDFERISVAHGVQVEENAKQVFAEGMAREL